MDNKKKPVLFLLKTLSPAERNYWPTKLETGVLVWALQKLPQYLDENKFIIYINHKAIVDTFKDIGPIYKKSPRLTNWRLFLAKYTAHMDIRHWPEKIHANADALSRLQTKEAIARDTEIIR
jgi:hypothetical protein